MIRLGVNVDHVATVRQARRTVEPDPVAAAVLAELAGADGITVHLREDRRHIQDRDLRLLKETVRTHLNLEMAASREIIGIALECLPDQATLVPEKRREVTTEGGLDVAGNSRALSSAVSALRDAGIMVSLFVDPSPEMIRASAGVGADAVELHTGCYANAGTQRDRDRELELLKEAAALAEKNGLRVLAGHGLTYFNIRPITTIAQLEEVNIGHSIISRAVLVGLERAVREMKALLTR
ncbi:MAG: pyridoxine 5'-phosphate synthase [Candidatus Glassbacteria bacterium]|nr:pyridoxine 5'-phosphate synthase [Candidatus Glassbacteria bacterium]